jgi:Protein of unknown function (DUF4197)
MRKQILVSFGAAVMLCTGPALGQLDRITNKEAVAGLKAALEKGSQAAVAALGRTDGFLGNPAVRIPLPDSLTRAESLMRRFGMGKYADELVVSMNRAAEAAVPEARQLFVDAIRKMTVQDAKGILTGGETAGTEYFQRATKDPLHNRFLPIVRKATEKVGLAQRYNEYAEKGTALGLIKKEQSNLDEYVTQKALDGLYLMLAEEEKKIRKDPVAAGTNIIRKVFGALR